jgi:hypothetical protein
MMQLDSCDKLRFIPEKVAEASQIFLRDLYLTKITALRNTADVLSHSFSGLSAVIPLVAFYDLHEKERYGQQLDRLVLTVK